MRIINNDEILQHSGITETDLMNYYGLSKAQYDDYIAHYGVKGMLWGFIDGVRQAGKRVAQGLDYDYQNNKYHKQILDAEYKARDAKKNMQDLYNLRETVRKNTGPGYSNKAMGQQVNKAGIVYSQSLKNVQNAVNSRNNFQNSTYGKTLKTIKNVRTAVSSTASKALSTVKSTKAYQVGAKVANKVTSKISSLSSSALSKAKSVGQSILSKFTKKTNNNGVKQYSSSIGPTKSSSTSSTKSSSTSSTKSSSTSSTKSSNPYNVMNKSSSSYTPYNVVNKSTSSNVPYNVLNRNKK